MSRYTPGVARGPNFVYMMNSASRPALYTGVTSDLKQRVWQHKAHEFEGFTQRYECTRLVWYELFHTIDEAIEREKQIKGWRREKKERLVNAMNPEWRDLSAEWYRVQEFAAPPHDGREPRENEENTRSLDSRSKTRPRSG
jgi:predicted GIY-YIG superfamily endonuclease